MTQSQRARRARAFVALAAFVFGALLHVVLTDAFSNPRSTYDALQDRPSVGAPSAVSKVGTTKQPSLVRAVRTSSSGKDQLDAPSRAVVDWTDASATASLRGERTFVTASGIRIANRPRDPPST